MTARLRGDRVKTAWLDVSPGSVAVLGESQKSECASGKARGRGGLGAVKLQSSGVKNKREGRPKAASAYVIDIQSLGASLHKRPTDQSDRVYSGRLEVTIPVRKGCVHHRNCNSGGDSGRTNQRMPGARR